MHFTHLRLWITTRRTTLKACSRRWTSTTRAEQSTTPAEQRVHVFACTRDSRCPYGHSGTLVATLILTFCLIIAAVAISSSCSKAAIVALMVVDSICVLMLCSF